METIIVLLLHKINRKLDILMTTQAQESAQIAANAQATQQILTTVQGLGPQLTQYIADETAFRAKVAAGTSSQEELDADNASLTTQAATLTQIAEALSALPPAITAADAVNQPAAASSGSSTEASASGATAANASTEAPANAAT
jgi:hypothetical protein